MKSHDDSRERIVLTLGFFDGVHLGHQQLIQASIKKAKELHCKSGVMTFREHPLTHIFPTYSPWLITTNTDKIKIMKSLGIDEVFLNPFNEALMRCPPKEFIRDYLLQKYNVVHIVVGFNYTFGYKGEGDIQALKALGEHFKFGVTVIPPCIIDGHSVSSSLIRELISTGKVNAVAAFLGRDYSVKGTVVRGKGLGHTFDIPTANLKMKEKIILPSSGVYYTKFKIDGMEYDGLTNLGFNPTFDKHPYSIETYIYDFDQDIYGKDAEITFKEHVRGEIKFDHLEALIAKIKSDIEYVATRFRK